MNWTAWIPAISSSTVLGAAGFLLGALAKSQIEKRIQHEFDHKLEELKAKARREEEALRAALRENGAELAAFRSGALTGLSARQSILTTRRVEAVERIWSETIDLSRFKVIAMLGGAMDIIVKGAASKGGDALKMREFAKMMLEASGLADPKLLSSLSADRERPFVDPIVWALFSAYRQAIGYPAILMQLARHGVDEKAIQDPPPVVATLKVAMPEYSEYIDKNGISAIHYMLQPLEEKLLQALSNSLEGGALDEASVQQASRIIKAVNEAKAAIDAANQPSVPAVK